MLLMLVLMGAVVLISLPSLSEGEEDKGKYLKLYRHHDMGRRFIGIVLNVSWFLVLEE